MFLHVPTPENFNTPSNKEINCYVMFILYYYVITAVSEGPHVQHYGYPLAHRYPGRVRLPHLGVHRRVSPHALGVHGATRD